MNIFLLHILEHLPVIHSGCARRRYFDTVLGNRTNVEQNGHYGLETGYNANLLPTPDSRENKSMLFNLGQISSLSLGKFYFHPSFYSLSMPIPSAEVFYEFLSAMYVININSCPINFLPTLFLYFVILSYHGILQCSTETRSDRLMTQVLTLENNFSILTLHGSAPLPAFLCLNFKKETIYFSGADTCSSRPCKNIGKTHSHNLVYVFKCHSRSENTVFEEEGCHFFTAHFNAFFSQGIPHAIGC